MQIFILNLSQFSLWKDIRCLKDIRFTILCYFQSNIKWQKVETTLSNSINILVVNILSTKYLSRSIRYCDLWRINRISHSLGAQFTTVSREQFQPFRDGETGCVFYSKTVVTAHRLDPLRQLIIRRKFRLLPSAQNVASRRARWNYSRRPSRDDDNSRFRLRSLIETQPSLLFPSPAWFCLMCAAYGAHI